MQCNMFICATVGKTADLTSRVNTENEGNKLPKIIDA